MAFLIGRAIATESEEEFDAENDRYEDLKSRLLGGETMKYGELEELSAAAKARGDREVADVLKNVVGDRQVVDEDPDDALRALEAAIGRLKGAGDLTADDARVEGSDKLVLSYEDAGWYDKLDRWAEDPEDDVESDLAKIYDALLKSGYGLQYSRSELKQAIADSAAEAASDPAGVKPKENRFGDWDCVATCNVYVPFKIVDGPASVLPEDDGREQALPDRVVAEALETLRRMY